MNIKLGITHKDGRIKALADLKSLQNGDFFRNYLTLISICAIIILWLGYVADNLVNIT